MTFVVHPALTRWAELSTPEPFDEAQVDGHYIDLKDQWCAIPLSDGTHRLTRVSGLMLLAEIDVASRACMGWTVIVDEAYSQFDFRSEERLVGHECVRTFRYRWAPYH